MRVLLTGAAGFIGYHVSAALAERGEEVLGVDCFTPYYARALKDARIARLQQQGSFAFQEMDVADHGAFKSLAVSFRPQKIVHLAAQAGVRYSLEAPFAYLHANVEGHLSALEAARGLDGLDHLVYASSGSVYGANTKVPFAEADRVDKPASLYSATKRSAELMSETYRRLFGIPQTGLRFFSVYGPWGRPDMAYWLFTEAVLKGQPIQLFDGGRMKRDWTYVDDIVNGVVAAIDRPPTEDRPVYNLGNNRPETGKRLLEVIEQATGQKAIVNDVPAPATELETTYADITLASQDLGFAPATSLDEGIPRFVAWFRDYAGL
jgi:UDP-glucuronate 4-epimerase